MNELLALIQKRRSVRRYTDEPIEQELLEQIVEAGRWAPTGGNNQSVHFTVIMDAQILQELRDKVQKAFAEMELSEDLYKSLQNSIRASKRGNYCYDYNAPVLVVVSNVKGYSNALADSSCALQNMMLQATSLGVGSCWINQLHWLDEDASVRRVLKACGIGEEETICGALALGKPDVEPLPVKRTGMKVTWIKGNGE